MSSASLNAAAQERKARLAQLKSLKRKQPDSYQETSEDITAPESPAKSPSPDIASTYLSGRNYDASVRGPKLGFESAPSESQQTLEKRAQELSLEVRQRAVEEAKEDKPLDLFKLQPKKPNWDLKRDLEKKLEVLNVRTENAIARLVRQRIEQAQKAAKGKGGADLDGDGVGMEGVTLVEALNVREREDEEEERRENAELEDV